MMHMEVTKAAAEWRRTRLRAQSEQDLNRMLQQLGFDDWRVVCRHEDEGSSDASWDEEPEP